MELFLNYIITSLSLLIEFKYLIYLNIYIILIDAFYYNYSIIVIIKFYIYKKN